MKTLLKPLSFIPALLLMYMIFTFSSQTGDVSGQLSYKVSCKIVEAGDYILDANLDDWQIDEWANKINFITRKLAHMTEYFALAIAVSFPLYVYGLHGFMLMLVAGFICVGFAAGDEYHQSFVAGRGPSTKDVVIDSVGVFFGIILVRMVGWTGRMTLFKDRSDKKEAKRLKKQMKKAKKAEKAERAEKSARTNPAPVIQSTAYHNGSAHNAYSAYNKKKRSAKKKKNVRSDIYDTYENGDYYGGGCGDPGYGNDGGGYGSGYGYPGNGYSGGSGYPGNNGSYPDGSAYPGGGIGYPGSNGYPGGGTGYPDGNGYPGGDSSNGWYPDGAYYAGGYPQPPKKKKPASTADSLADDWNILKKKKTDGR